MGSPSVRSDQPKPINSSAAGCRRGSTAIPALLWAAQFMRVLDLSIVGVEARTGQRVVLLWRHEIYAMPGQPWHAGNQVDSEREVQQPVGRSGGAEAESDQAGADPSSSDSVETAPISPDQAVS